MSPVQTAQKILARSFNKAAAHYDKHAIVQNEIGHRLIERLKVLDLSPHSVLDVGSGTGIFTQALQRFFPSSTVIGMDLSLSMIQQARKRLAHSSLTPHYACGNMQSLPFQNQCFDLIFSNFTLQWATDLPLLFKDFKRILSPKGVLLFTTLGPDTLQELRESLATFDHYEHIRPFYDMHDIGDMLMHAGYHDPVVDKECITVRYENVIHLLEDLKGVGSANLSASKNPGCLTKHWLKNLQSAYEPFRDLNHLYPATYEIIYGYALIPQLHRCNADGIIEIPGNKIPILS